MASNYSDLHFSTLPAAAVENDLWRRLIEVSKRAIDGAYADRPDILASQDILEMTDDRDLAAFKERFIRPDASRSTRNTEQLYANPEITVAINRRQILGWVATVHNTSGENAEEKMQAQLPYHTWLKLAWTARLPEASHHGIATKAAAFAIARSHPVQPVSAFAWPGGAGHKMLIASGLRPVEAEPDFDNVALGPVRLPTRRYVSHDSRVGLLRSLITVKGRAKLRAAMNS